MISKRDTAEERALLEWLTAAINKITEDEKEKSNCVETAEEWEKLASVDRLPARAGGFATINHWARILERDLANDKYNAFAVSGIMSGCMMFYSPVDHASITPKKKQKGELVPVDMVKHFKRLEDCGAAFSPIVSNVACYSGDDLVSVKTEGRRLCNIPALCAVDAFSRSAEDKKINEEIVSYAYEHGFAVDLVTVTASHGWDTIQNEFLPALGFALRDLRFDDRFERAAEKYGVIALGVGRPATEKNKEKRIIPEIRRLEVTFGPNGCHYHFHLVIIRKKGKRARLALEKLLRKLWETYAKKYGLLNEHDPIAVQNFRENGLDYNGSVKRKKRGNKKEDVEKIADYASKINEWHEAAREWGKVGEVSLSVLKESNKGHYNPFELAVKVGLVDWKAVKNAKNDNEKKAAYAVMMRDINTLIEYACAVYNRHLIERTNGLLSWAADVESRNPQEVEKETLCGLHAVDYDWIRRLGLVPYYNAVVRASAEGNPEPLAVFQNWLESKGAVVPSVHEILVLRENEERKREEERRRRAEQKEARKEIQARLKADQYIISKDENGEIVEVGQNYYKLGEYVKEKGFAYLMQICPEFAYALGRALPFARSGVLALDFGEAKEIAKKKAAGG